MNLSVIPFLSFCLLLSFLGCVEKGDDSSRLLNRLENSASPYLREHADNPVDWYEWGPEALKKAKDENKPLVISIGYAACHWCHVMEEETFMDTAVAKFMNDNFVSIKIDREERPDIDQIYLDAAQLISGNSGWPLNAFALPDGKPFYAATYFPKATWQKLIQQISNAYKSDHANVVKQAAALTNGLRSNNAVPFSDSVSLRSEQTLEDIFANWEKHFDQDLGGLAGSPKFPMPVVWEYALQYHYLTGDAKALDVVETTLDGILSGGIYDVLGGGFARYAVDDKWLVPHFEKMLYDNGQLVSLYSHAYQVTGNPGYAGAIEKTLQFIDDFMTSPEGGFYSSLNADSEGEEGKFYVWKKEEIDRTLDENVGDLFIEYYNVSDSGNWEKGKNILHSTMTTAEFALKKGLSKEELEGILDGAKMVLLKKRDERIPPSLDDKILTSWNALMLQGYIDAYSALNNPKYLRKALDNGDFLIQNLLQPDGRLSRTYKDGASSIDAFLEDYALLSRAFINLYQITFEVKWLEKARTMTEYAIAHFRDKETGLFYYTPADADDLILRRIETADNVIPSSNSVIADVLFLLGVYFGNDSYIEMSESMVSQILPMATTGGPYYANWARLAGLITYKPSEVAVMGEDALVRAREMQSNYIPTAIFMGGKMENLPLLKNKLVEKRTMIYVCRNKVCKSPEENAERALAQINQYTQNASLRELPIP